MRESDFQERAPGTLVRSSGPSGEYWAYVPNSLPPPLSFDHESVRLLSDAVQALGELKGVGRMIQNPHLLIAPFLRREAVSSSRIEGTITNLEQLLLFEADPSGKEDAADRQEVENYVIALKYGLDRLKTLPVSLRLMREIHERLMRGVRGEELRPGEFRDRQNMIGREGQTPAEARFVPPPVPHMMDALRDLEKFIGYPSGLPALVDLALIHYQFETIHPFLDGNGRLGRLLLPLLLCEKQCLTQPLLYLSDYFERHREAYVNHLLMVSQTGDWQAWINFFLRGVAVQSRITIERCNELLDLSVTYRSRLLDLSHSTKALQLVDLLFERPALTVRQVAGGLNVTFAGAKKNVERLVASDILREATGKQKNRIYMAHEIISILGKPAPSGTS